MCIVFVKFDPKSNTPVLVGANREESPDRPYTSPKKLQVAGVNCVIAGDDRGPNGQSTHTGTWFGYNERGLFVAVTNRDDGVLKGSAIKDSRGLLCARLLRHNSAYNAAEAASLFLSKGRFGGSNYLIVDLFNAFIVHSPSPETTTYLPLDSGVHVLTNLDINDPNDRRINFVHASLTGDFDFVPLAKDILTAPEIIVGDERWGTVSSSIFTVTVSQYGELLKGMWHSERKPETTNSYQQIEFDT